MRYINLPVGTKCDQCPKEATRELTVQFWFRIAVDDLEKDWKTVALCNDCQYNTTGTGHKITEEKPIRD